MIVRDGLTYIYRQDGEKYTTTLRDEESKEALWDELVTEWPRIPFSERDKLPKHPGIYTIWHKGKLLYVGKAVNLRSRWKNHHRTEQLLMFFDDLEMRYMIYPAKYCGTKGTLDLHEYMFIDLFRPMLNSTRAYNLPAPPDDATLQSENDYLRRVVSELLGLK